MSCRIFFPVSSRDYDGGLKKGQRYRHPFGDKRIFHQINELSSLMLKKQSVIINQLGMNRSQKSAFYNVLNNPYVEIGELIHESCKISPELVEGESLLCLLDTTSVSLVSKKKEKRKDNPLPGVVDDNQTPGFYMHTALVATEYEEKIIGLGDIVIFTRPKNNLDKQGRRMARFERSSLPLEQKESYVWSLSSSNCAKQLKRARQTTYILDQGGDKYDSLAHLLRDTDGADFIVRAKEDRMVYDYSSKEEARISMCLSKEVWQDEREIEIRALDHTSKSSGKRVLRQQRKAKLKIRYLPVSICKPANLSPKSLILEGIFNIIEVIEDASSVPPQEDPIHWRILTSRSVENVEQAWHIVKCYQCRWNVEQLFRVFKKQGLDIEKSQFENPDAIKRQAILGLKTSAQVMQLSSALKQEVVGDISTVFSSKEEIAVLQKVNKKVSGQTQKSANPHKEGSLVWAAWIIARLGGWNGYQKGRSPGPITIHTGIKQFYSIIWAINLINDT